MVSAAPTSAASSATPPRAPPPPPTRAATLPSSNTDADGCPDRESLDLAAEDLREADALIKRAGEHPSDRDLDRILPLLKRAAYAGHEAAQRRFGYYVVGYYYTDEMFWPKEPDIAIAALAMLRVAARRTPDGSDQLMAALARDPVKFTGPDSPPALPRAWVNAAVKEARRWEDCAAR
jgi:hypothetical protein